ncbi:cysteine hydrolase family protein [Maridesulfovibrio hydrothermalis]|uniref:Putative hydrolase n=1 Tax=Maridesulfovibrio hydrothermalis AM13 = DSM 14728 TaxID=1121451 RepID=L0RIQ9_9BACT|nr:cysteine hydrolase family protein [Maridesulfovibrio hydrothermalis]CCO25456.1 putative hydrolase [Maridesulfovibrio hydrothermalis AM13 = DSM 14728]
MKKQALLIIDIQNDYFTGGNMALDNSKKAGDNATKILDHFREKGQSVIHIQHESTTPGAAFFLPDTEGVKIHNCVAPHADETVLTKNFPNSFRKTGLKDCLDKLGVTDLVITGMMSNMCVDATVRAGFDSGYNCTVIHDGCCAAKLEFRETTVDSDKVHAAFMAALGAVYAELVSAEEFIRN